MQFIGVVLVDTDRAFLFQDWFWHDPEWMPKSQTSIRREHDTAEVVVEASAWISKQKGLQEFKERVNAG